jgi:carbon starvation protein
MKIWSTKAAGFLPEIAKQKTAIAGGLSGEALRKAETALTNARVDVVITAMFLVLVAAIVIGCSREWWLLLRKQKPVVLRESEYVALPD